MLNPNISRFTWRRRCPKIRCRLDFFLVNQSVFNITTLSEIYPGYKSDHSMITLKLSLHSNLRGPGLWKLNTSFLTEINYINQIKATIPETQEEYREDDIVNPSLLWEMIKLKVREKTLTYSKNRKKQTKQGETELEQGIAKLGEELDKRNHSDTQVSDLEEEINKQKLELEKIKGTILRSKTKWYNEGEKNTKYFLNLEKRHYKQSTIGQIKIGDNTFVTSDGHILNECASFYKNLYESKNTTGNCLIRPYSLVVKTAQPLRNTNRMLAKDCFLKKCLEALKTMESEKTPGTDGFPAEFYKVFWNDIPSTLINALNFAYETGQLSITQRRGIIKLIPKKDAEPYYIKNWRPLTLFKGAFWSKTRTIVTKTLKIHKKFNIKPKWLTFSPKRHLIMLSSILILNC